MYSDPKGANCLTLKLEKEKEMEIQIQMKKIVDMEEFDAEEFCITPSYWSYRRVNYYNANAKDAMEEAKKLAESVDGICIAIVKDPLGEYVLGEHTDKGCSSKFMLFNAAETGRVDAEVHAITFNTGRGAMSRYWTDRWLKYQKGSIW